MKDGSISVVLARELNGEPQVIKKVPYEGKATLRLELSPDKSQVQ